MIKYTTGGSESLDQIAPLWKKLNRHHARISLHFSSQISQKTFPERKSELLEQCKNGKMRVDMVKSMPENKIIGYCVSSINAENIGEVDSIYVEPSHREKGIGNKLMERALSWLDFENVDSKILIVLYENEDVFKFYSQFGFTPRSMRLVQSADDNK